MTIAELKKYISKMPDDAQIKADESLINGVTATINSEGDIIVVNLEI